MPKRHGVLIHDCWAPYWRIEGVHALCNAHLLRELVYVKEVSKQTWPQRMSDFLITTNIACETARQQQKPLSPTTISGFMAAYETILSDGDRDNPEVTKRAEKRGRSKQSITFNLLRRLRKFANAVLLFIHDPSVPFTDNLGERTVRMPKVKQKISGCFRTLEGAENFCVIRYCVDTLRKQGHGMLDVLQHAFSGNPIRPAHSC